MNTTIQAQIEKKIGVFYGRHSTVHQDIEAQLYSLQSFADRYHCEIIDQYLDKAVSARKKNLEERKEINRLLSDARNGKFHYVVVYAADRLARDPYEHCIIRMQMKDLGIPIYLSHNDTVYDTGDILVQTVRDAVSKYEVQKIRTNTRNAYFTHVLSHGQWGGGAAPYGYSYDKSSKLITSVPSELIHVKKVFELYMKGDGFEEIAKQMSPSTFRNSDWKKHKVRRIITNPFYAGYLSIYRTDEFNKNCINADKDSWHMVKCDQIEPVVTLQQWEYCWNMYMKKRSNEISPQFYRTHNVLKDLLYCESCKKPPKY